MIETNSILSVEVRKETFRHYAQLALSFQKPDHSWNAYLDQPEPYFESSATAGLTAAFAHGNRIGWLPEFTKDEMAAIYQRLLESTTPDGLYVKCIITQCR